MAATTRKSDPVPNREKISPQDWKHLDEGLDEALEETFPASDPPAMLEPVPGGRRKP